MVFTEATEVAITRAEPQGINPQILVLRLTITEKAGPMKGTPRSFNYSEHGDHVGGYSQVQVISNLGDDCAVDVHVFG